MKLVQADDFVGAKKSETILHERMDGPRHTDFPSHGQIKHNVLSRTGGRQKVMAVREKTQDHHIGMGQQVQESVEAGERVERRLESYRIYRAEKRISPLATSKRNRLSSSSKQARYLASGESAVCLQP